MSKLKFKIEGMKELERSMKILGKVPQKHVTAAAKKGMNIALKDAKANAPEDTGALKKGIIKVAERSKIKGKKVYRVVFDRSMNDIFQKTAVHTMQFRMYHGHNRSQKDPRYELKKYYYPVSQEYGYFTKNGKYIPGFMFGHKALTENKEKIEKTIVSTMKTKIDTEIAKVGLK